MSVPAGCAPTIAQDLEARRLAHRASRLKRVIAALEDRRMFRESVAGQTPPALRAALAGFREELAEVEARIDALAAA